MNEEERTHNIMSYSRQAPEFKTDQIKSKSPESAEIGAFGYTLFSDTGP